MSQSTEQLKSIRRWTWFFMAMLTLSGLTASPVEWELSLVKPYVDLLPEVMQHWFDSIEQAILLNSAQYPFVMYAFDWLAFAHVVIAVYMYGLIVDPVRNRWLVQAALVACVLIFPLAFVMGAIRGIPFWWRLIDCSFGAFGIIPLLVLHKKIHVLEQMTQNADKNLHSPVSVS